jgi:WD40 repeat protein/DNA-binding SARP family transcriptional activator
MDFGVLGPLEVLDHDRSVQLGGPKQRTVLVHLLLRANKLVTAERLIDALWGEEPPASARNTLQTYIKHLRKLVGSERIEHVSSGYVLRVDPGELDLLGFETLIEEARALIPADLPAAAAGLRGALSLWRGPALDDLSEQPSLRPEITRLEELRIATIEERIGADLALGRHHELIPELETFVAHHPFREGAWGYLMVALYRSGRQGDALAAYRRAREVLTAELGIDPSPELQHIQDQILQQDVALDLGGEPLRGYRLLELLGEGAFGAVHRAFQPEVGREVAVKIVHPRLAKDPEFVRRFAAEAQLVARLEHPHIVPVYDYWRDPEGAYLVMRYLRGGSLRQLLAVGGPLEPGRAAQVIDGVANALATAHRLGVVHRDVQPANILFDEGGNTYLSDFGIARDLATAQSARGWMSPGDIAYYLSPEEARGETPTQRADIYSLGLVLYECLTGRRALAGSPIGEHVEEPREPILTVGAVRPDLPPAIDAVVRRATANDPAERYPDVLEFATSAGQVLGGVLHSARDGEVGVRNPYKGLRAFSDADTEDFFGREELVQRLVAQLADGVEGYRFLGVVGPSGSGKSSVVRAGLIPALRAGALPGSETWFYTEMTPGRHPFDELEGALLKISVDTPSGLRDQLERDEGGLAEAVACVLPEPDSELVLVVDQFEELFTLVDDDDVIARFLGILVSAVADPRSRLHVIVTLRADFFDRPLAHQGFGELLGSRVHTITPLAPQDLERAIAGPAEAVGVTVERALVVESSVEFADRPGALPLLEYALTEAFERRGGQALTLDGYWAIGGISGALARRADEFYEGLDDTGKECVHQLSLRLVELGEDSVETRRRVPRAELGSVRVDGRPVDSVADALGASRLISFDCDPITRGPTVEVAHEALLRGWDRLAAWIDEAQNDLRTNRGLEHDAAAWAAGDRDPSLLLRGSRLEQIETWTAQTDLALMELTHEYVNAGLRKRDNDWAAEEVRKQRETTLQRRSVIRLRGLVAVLAAGTLVAGSLALVARDRGRHAEREARIGEARKLAGAAIETLTVDAARSIRLALDAVETTYRVDGTVIPEATEALHLALQADRLELTVPGYKGWFSSDGSRLLVMRTKERQYTGRSEVGIYDALTGALISHAEGPGGGGAAFSADGERFATAGWGDVRTVSVFASDTGRLIQRLSIPDREPDLHLDPALPLAFSPNGRFLTTGSTDSWTNVWDLRWGSLVRREFVTGPAAFSPGSRQLVVADNYLEEHQQWLYLIPDIHHHGGGRLIAILYDEAATSEISGVAWSPDGSRLAMSTSERVVVWNAENRKQLFSLFPPGGTITSLALGPESLLATGMADGTAIVWALSPDGGEPILTVGGHTAKVDTVSFNKDGTRLATASNDGTVKVWNVDTQTGGEWINLPGSVAVAYSPDGQLIATGSEGGNISTFDAASGQTLRVIEGHAATITALDFDPSGSMLASGSVDGTARAWDVSTGHQFARIEVPDQVWDVAFSPDGSTLATESWAGNSTHLWDPTTGELLRTFAEDLDDAGWPRSVDFSRDGRLVAGEEAGSARVWRVQSGEILAEIPQEWINALAFSPGGGYLVTGALDGSIRLWDPSTGRQVDSLSANLGEVTDLAYSPGGVTIASSSADGTVRLWDADNLDPIMTIATDADGKLAFSPDGTRLAYTARGNVVRVLALAVDDLIELARSRLEPSGSAA